MVKINGTGIKPDLVLGKKASLDFHYHTLVMEEGKEEQNEVTICADVTAYCGSKIAGKLPACSPLSKPICLLVTDLDFSRNGPVAHLVC